MDKILLVEDDPTMLSLLHTLLQMEGYRVVDLDHGRYGDSLFIDVVRLETPRLVLLDVNLQQLNGFELLQCLRRHADLATVRVLVASGMDVRQRCLDEGADGFLLKPYSPDELTSTISKILDNNEKFS